jgi:hypothetical protein
MRIVQGLVNHMILRPQDLAQFGNKSTIRFHLYHMGITEWGLDEKWRLGYVKMKSSSPGKKYN